MSIYKGIEHIAIFSQDTKRLKDWYEKYLDMTTVSDNGKGVYFLLLRDGSMIELIPAVVPAHNPTPNKRDSGLRHIALLVDRADFGPAVQRLIEEAGVTIVGESPRQYPEGMATFNFRDPDGNILHLIFRSNRLALAACPNLTQAPVNPLIQGIEHTAIAARDPERLIQWYIDMLGFTLIARDDGHGTTFILARDGHSIIEFLQAEADVGMHEYNAAGIRHIGISVRPDDAEYAARLLRASGVEVIEHYKVLENGLHVFFFRDPEGNVIHLIGRPQPLAH